MNETTTTQLEQIQPSSNGTSSAPPPSKDVLTVIQRGGRLRKDVVNSSGPKPLAMLLFWGSIVAVIAFFVKAGSAQADVSKVGTIDHVKPALAVTSIVKVDPALSPVPKNTEPTKFPTPTITPTQLPPTITPTFTPTITPTRIPDVWLSIQAVWPPGFDKAKTVTGALVSSVAGWGAACPERFVLGTELILASGQRFVCVDRAKLTCTDTICRVFVYSQQKGIPSMVQAYINSTVKGTLNDTTK